MNLGLLDILTAQGSSQVGFDQRSIDRAKDSARESFKDYISRPESNNNTENKLEKSDADVERYIKEYVKEVKNSNSANKADVGVSKDNKGFLQNTKLFVSDDEGLSEEAKYLLSQIESKSVNLPAKISGNGEITTSTGQTVSIEEVVGTNESITEYDLIQNIKSLSEHLDPEVVEEIKVAVEAILAAKGQEVKKNDPDVALSKFKSSIPLNEAEGFLVQDATVVQNAALENVNNDVKDLNTLNKIASKVIQQVIEDESHPEVSTQDISSAQIASLLGAGKSDDDNKKIVTKNLNIDANAKFNADVQLNADELAKGSLFNIRQTELAALAAKARDKVSTTVTAESNVEVIHTEGEAIEGILPDSKSGINFDPLKVSVSNEPARNFVDTLQVNNLAGNESSTNTLSDPFVKLQRIDGGVGNLQKANLANKFVSSEDVVAQIKFSISNNAGKGDRNITIQLHPKELGSVDVNMKLNSDGKNTVTIIAEKTDTLNLLQKEATSLRDMLADALKTDSGNLQFSFQERGDGGFGSERSAPNLFNPYANINEASEMQNNIAQYGYIATNGVDIRV